MAQNEKAPVRQDLKKPGAEDRSSRVGTHRNDRVLLGAGQGHQTADRAGEDVASDEAPVSRTCRNPANQPAVETPPLLDDRRAIFRGATLLGKGRVETSTPASSHTLGSWVMPRGGQRAGRSEPPRVCTWAGTAIRPAALGQSRCSRTPRPSNATLGNYRREIPLRVLGGHPRRRPLPSRLWRWVSSPGGGRRHQRTKHPLEHSARVGTNGPDARVATGQSF